jgi:hypothetical protein
MPKATARSPLANRIGKGTRGSTLSDRTELDDGVTRPSAAA